MTGGFFILPAPDASGGFVSGRCLELPGGYFVGQQAVEDEHWPQAAALSASRLKRCRRGSLTWHWHRAIIAENDRRRRARLILVPGGAP